jgi:hypothetical protein
MSETWIEVDDPILCEYIRGLRREWRSQHPRADPQRFEAVSGYFHFRVRTDGTVVFHAPVGQTLSSSVVLAGRLVLKS